MTTTLGSDVLDEPFNAGWDLAIGTWADTEALVGAEIGSSEGADEVNRIDIRRRLEVLSLDAPIHYDLDAARHVGYTTIVSPASMVLAWTLPAYWRPGDPKPELDDPRMVPHFPFPNIPAPGDAIFASACDTRYLAPMYPGDRISSSSTLRSVTHKTLSVGPGAFLVVRTTYSNQHGDAVAIEDMTVFRYTASPVTDLNGATVRTRRWSPALDEPVAAAKGDRVEVGHRLPVFVLPLTLQRLVMEAGVNRDFTPSHHDVGLARASGAPTAYANTACVMAVVEAALREWMGDAGVLDRLDIKMIAFNRANSELRAGGSITAIDRSGELRTPTGAAAVGVDVDVWMTSGSAKSVTGRARVRLPVGERGAA